MFQTSITLLSVFLCVALAACSDNKMESEAGVSASGSESAFRQDSDPGQGAAVYGDWGVDLTAGDEAIVPGDDFFSYINGGWLKANDIPPERTSYGVGLIIHERAEQRVRDIIDELGAQSGAEGTPEQKVGDYYASWMSAGLVNELGITPLRPDLDRIAGIKGVRALTEEFGRSAYVSGIRPIFAGLGINPKNPDEYNMNVGLGGMGLPDRDYYLDDTDEFREIRVAYEKHIAQMLAFSGYGDEKTYASAIVALETKIASLQWIRADRRDRDKTFNPTTVKALRETHPEYNWEVFFESAGIHDLKDVNVSHPDTIAPLINLINTIPLETWKAYLSYHLISNNAALLSEQIDGANFDFWGGVIQGREQQLDRWKRGVARVGAKNGLGEALGQIYVKRHFHENSKAKMNVLVENLRAAYGERIDALDWMSAPTKVEARAKLAAFKAKIGYPDQWLALDEIKINKADLFGNSRRIDKFFEDFDSNRLGQPTDREEWFMMPQTVNAYYLSSFNEIVFPAAILEAPYFDPNADSAVNYGAIGAIIGHEMGHGFDDQGSKSDAKGIKRNWWNDADRTAFDTRTAKLAEQYSQYEAVKDNYVDGKFTLGENIGDLGGLEVALRAYQLSLAGEPAPVIDGLTGIQRFFISYAQSWREKVREEATLQRLKSDPHSPAKFRVNGVVRNVDEWYSAFNVEKTNALYLPESERVSIW